MQNWGDLPEAPIRLEHLDAGCGEFHDEWTHTKTVPFGIIAQALEGTYIVRTPQGVITASEGETFITPPNMPLEITHLRSKETGVMRMRFVHFRFSYLGAVDLFDLYDPTGTSDLERGLLYGGLIEQLLQIKTREEGVSFRDWTRKSMIAFRLLDLVLESAAQRAEHDIRLSHMTNIKPLLDYIARQLSEPLNIDMLLKHGNYSRSALFSLFRNAFGQTPMEYIKSQRLDTAFRKLVTTTLPVAEIAEQTGFASSFHFSRAFKARFRKTPSEARRENGIWQARTSGGYQPSTE